MRSELIKQTPDRAIIGKIACERLGAQLITNPRHGQVVPVKAQLGNQKSVSKYGDGEEHDRQIQFSHAGDKYITDLSGRMYYVSRGAVLFEKR